MNKIVILLLLSTMIGCSSTKLVMPENITSIGETRIDIGDDIKITKNGVETGNVKIQPTIMNNRINGVRYPNYYGITITIKF